jgi:hypothetical protein
VLRALRVDCTAQTLQLFYNDEHALTLGVRQVQVKTSSGTTTTNYPVSMMVTDPDSAIPPMVGSTIQSGDQAGTDVSGRPMFPSLFVTDVTANPGNPLAGDWQYGGTPIQPDATFGTWKAAVRLVDKTKNPNVVTVTPDGDPATNNWNLGPGSDPVPPGLVNQGYGNEVRWNMSSLGLIPGHQYRFYFIVHDGDQNKTGGDAGQGCVYFTMPGTAPTPTPTPSATASPSPTATATPTPTCSTAATVVATGTASNGKTMTTSSFTFKANTTYLVFVFTETAGGDSATFSSTGLGSPTFNNIGSGSLNYNTNDYEYGQYLNGGNNANGTITVTTVKTISKPSYIQVVELCGNDTVTPIAQSAYATGNNTNPYTANLPAPPLVGTNFDAYFLDASDDLGPSAPTGTPAVTNLFYAHGGGTAAGTYFKDTPSQNESFAGGNKHWATIAVEIKRP